MKVPIDEDRATTKYKTYSIENRYKENRWENREKDENFWEILLTKIIIPLLQQLGFLLPLAIQFVIATFS